MENDRIALLMVQAAVAGAVDFSKVSRQDSWWWRRTSWVLSELERSAERHALCAQHAHWITAFSNARLDEEGFTMSRDHAQTSLDLLLSACLPWRETTATPAPAEAEGLSRENAAALAEFREVYGYPGEERYEAMLQSTLRAFQDVPEESP